MRFEILYVLVFFALASCSLASQTPEIGNPVYFPLAKGAYWIYQGTVKWTKLNTDQVMEKEMTWKMEVVDVIERDQITAYVMRGHPADLAWYEEGKTPSDYLLIYLKPNRYYEVGIGALERLKDRNDSLYSLVTDYQQVFDFPLSPAKKFCSVDQITRVDNRYCWVVGRENRIPLKGIKGVSPSKVIQEYELYFATLPDHQIVEFVSGLGITRFVYVHHGTISEVDVRLIEYDPGAE